MPTASDGRTRKLEALGAHDLQIGSLETLATYPALGAAHGTRSGHPIPRSDAGSGAQNLADFILGP